MPLNPAIISAKPLRRVIPAYVILTISLLMAVGLFFWVKNDISERRRARFREVIENTREGVKHRMNRYVDELQGVQGLFAASERVRIHEWTNYIASIDTQRRNAKMRSIAYVVRVRRADKADHEENLRKEGFSEYRVYPETTGDSIYPVVYHSESNLKLTMGWDVGSDPKRLEAMTIACASGLPTITGRIGLKNREGAGFAIYVPVYDQGGADFSDPVNSVRARSETLRGFVFGTFAPQRLFEGIFGRQVVPTVAFEVYDGDAVRPDQMLYASSPPGGAGEDNPEMMTEVFKMPLQNRTWTLRFYTLPTFDDDAQKYVPEAALLGGLLVSVLLFGIAWTQGRGRSAAERLSSELLSSQSELKKTNEQLQMKVLEKESAERMLAHERDLLHALLDNCPDRIYFKDSESRFLRCSRDLTAALGITNLDEVIGKTDFDFFTEDHARPAFEDELTIMRTGLPIVGKVEMETWVDGAVTWALTTKMPLRDKDGAVVGTFGISKDITALKNAQEELASEKERLSVTLRSIGDGVITTDTFGKIVVFNKVAESLTGWTQAEAAGKAAAEVFQVVQETSREPFGNPVTDVLRTGQIAVQAEHSVLIGRDGSERLIAQSGAAIRDREGQVVGVVIVFRDITEKVRTEAELLKASKLESVGLLAGGIAHDFNNILTAIIGNLALANMSVHSTEKLLERLSAVEKAAFRAKDLTQQLLTFSKGGVPIKKSVQITTVLRDAAQFALRGSNVNAEFMLAGDLWPVEADEGQVRQVIHNIVINAMQAMPEGGQVEVRAENVEVTSDYLAPLPGGNYVKVSIRDHGTGIRPEHLGKIFDPYFTTRRNATGLGLATAYSIVAKHDGQIKVESELGEGSTFHVYLPASVDVVVAGGPAGNQPQFFGQGRILVMDDEEDIRMVASMMLELLGYEVELARDGAEAVERYVHDKTSGRPFDALIMDLTIPNGMGGKEAIRRLREVDPGVKAIVSSGYSYDPVMANFRDYGFSGVVPKPYKVEDLGQALRDVLRGNN